MKQAQDQQAHQLLDPRRLGESFEKVSSEVIQTEMQYVISQWFHSSYDSDLFVWTDLKNNIIKQQVSICGQVVEWNLLEGVRTGMVLEEDSADETKGSEVIRFDASVQRSSVSLACQVIQHINELNSEVRELIISNFSQPKGPADFDKGLSVLEGLSAVSKKRRRPSFWSLIKQKIRQLFWLGYHK
jgi:hypothetical protein